MFKMASINYIRTAISLIQNEERKYPNVNPNHLAFGLQDSIQMRLYANPRTYGRDTDKFTDQEKMYYVLLSDALMSICIERFGSYVP